jgi:hypothetical protein
MFDKKENSKKWYIKNREKILKRVKKYREEHQEYYKEYRKKYHQEYKEFLNEKSKNYYHKHQEERQKYNNKRNKENRLIILNLISKNNPCCIRCGCNDIRLLEINHKNGGGGEEYKRGKLSTKFWLDIRMGRRKIDDLEILCRVCNACHYLELKFGKLPYRIFYNTNFDEWR